MNKRQRKKLHKKEYHTFLLTKKILKRILDRSPLPAYIKNSIIKEIQ